MQKNKTRLVRVVAFKLLNVKTRSSNFRMCIHKIHKNDKDKEGNNEREHEGKSHQERSN